ncbi:DNA polymerase subunit gamma-1-like [Actinia tenebrosa]|uniref:DNA polymerase subunit gamma-1 n=1 Tax=Actinia tenebrosa TaxID=6105 RepID=A0A6P8HXD2_ACTTE|nr:DNA polymerase subunit gamma-1-like [Actinia tenebrosa]
MYRSMLKKSLCAKTVTRTIRFSSGVYNCMKFKRKRLRTYCTTSNDGQNARFNQVEIQMLSEALHKQIFPGEFAEYNAEAVRKCVKHLEEHQLWGKNKSILPDVNLKLPALLGANIDEHFKIIAKQQSKAYFDMTEELAVTTLPPLPEEWLFAPGWHKYEKADAGFKVVAVEYPEEDGFVFDVEVCQNGGPFPTLAVAASSKAWYAWVSQKLVEETGYQWLVKPTPSLYIPLESTDNEELYNKDWREKLVIGHSVGYDRSYVKEQYYIKGPKTYFLDTLSLHMCVSGLTGHQRHLWNACNAGRKTKEPWMDVGSGNKLEDLYKLYSGRDILDKSMQRVFVDGDLDDIRARFQDLTTYCATDVACTHEIFTVIWPIYKERFPHPVSFAGMLEMGSAYLPVDESWDNYIRDSDNTFEDLEKEMKGILMKLANETCNYQHGKRYQQNPWLWSLDWFVQDIPIKAPKKQPKKKKKNKEKELPSSDQTIIRLKQNPTSNIHIDIEASESKNLEESELNIEDLELDERTLLRMERSGKHDLDVESLKEEAQKINDLITSIPAAEDVMYKRRRHLPGYPLWYRKICPKDGEFGSSLVSPQCQIAPSLLRMTWDSFPLHYSRKHGWGYLVPGRMDNIKQPDDEERLEEEEDGKVERDLPDMPFPTKSFQILWQNHHLNKDSPKSTSPASILDDELDARTLTESDLWSDIDDDALNNAKAMTSTSAKTKQVKKAIIENAEHDESRDFVSRGKSKPHHHHGVGPFNDVDLPGVWFFRIPHKNGEQYRCGNPLAKDYISKLDDGTLVTAGDRNARRTLVVNKMISFWRNAQKRIRSQMPVWLTENDLDDEIKRSSDFNRDANYGAIIPRVIPAGTVTRRAVEATWLTASNPREDRVGSEMKAMIRAPPGYSLVGADVDSQELWIAAVLGDANFAGIHGSTAFGWMTLQGKKSDGTDLHSKTASTIGISRDHAKVFNYGRIYGAGQKFAERLLLQFNHRLTDIEAKQKAETLYSNTKGTVKYLLSDYGHEIADRLGYTDRIDEDGCVERKVYWELVRSARRGRGSKASKMVDAGRVWQGGSESEMFNKLEMIAQSEEPRTPVLECRISRALEPWIVGNEFITSRVNWVVQSSAVDYLHLMLVSMKWLFKEYDIEGRFCISIHDEVRYLVADKDKYRAALALQITNLLTRSMFAYKLGMMDLPQSVAFFSAVDIDKVLRKEVTLDCKTPSNPHGLQEGHGIPTGEALDIYEILERTTGGKLNKEKPRVKDERLEN